VPRPYLVSVPTDEDPDTWRSAAGGTVTTFHKIPRDTVALRHESVVLTHDGRPAAHLHGVLVDETWHLTDLLLDPPHLWSRPLLPVPVEDVEQIRTDEVLLDLAPDELDRWRARHHALLRHAWR
jgi:hypothetical protein